MITVGSMIIQYFLALLIGVANKLWKKITTIFLLIIILIMVILCLSIPQEMNSLYNNSIWEFIAYCVVSWFGIMCGEEIGEQLKE